MATTVLSAPWGAAAEPLRPLPVPPVVFGLGALAGFLVLLGITWAFRNAGRRH